MYVCTSVSGARGDNGGMLDLPELDLQMAERTGNPAWTLCKRTSSLTHQGPLQPQKGIKATTPSFPQTLAQVLPPGWTAEEADTVPLRDKFV